jgi:hypothetical protein
MRPTELHSRDLRYLQKRKVRKFLPTVIGSAALVACLMIATLLSFWIPALSDLKDLTIQHPLFIASLALGVAGLVVLIFIPYKPQDFDSFIFYLRPFAEDSLNFEENEIGRVPRYLTGLRGTQTKSFEKFAAASLSRVGYRFISIGNPKALFPQAGGLKLYPSDFCWKFFVRRLIDKAEAILIRCQDTPGFRWELEHLSHNLKRIRMLLYIGMEDREEAAWPGTWKVLSAAGFQIPKEFPGRGCILYFDGTNHAVRIASHVASDNVFALAVKEALKIQPSVCEPSLPNITAKQPDSKSAEVSVPDDNSTCRETPLITPDSKEEAIYAAKLWRRQFMRNPFVLGPPGIKMLFIWFASIALFAWFAIWLSFNDSSSADAQLMFVLFIPLIGLLYGILNKLSGTYAQATEEWAAQKKNKVG